VEEIATLVGDEETEELLKKGIKSEVDWGLFTYDGLGVH